MGIGAAVCIELARRGADIVAVARHDGPEAREVRAEVESLGRRCLIIPADLVQPEACRRLHPTDGRPVGTTRRAGPQCGWTVSRTD